MRLYSCTAITTRTIFLDWLARVMPEKCSIWSANLTTTQSCPAVPLAAGVICPVTHAHHAYHLLTGNRPCAVALPRMLLVSTVMNSSNRWWSRPLFEQSLSRPVGATIRRYRTATRTRMGLSKWSGLVWQEHHAATQTSGLVVFPR